MEQKKTLFIIAAVGIFLLVIVGLGFLCFKPETTFNSNVPTVTYKTGKKLKDNNSGWTNPPAEKTSPAPVSPQDTPVTAKVNDMVVVADNATIYDLNKNQTETTNSTTIDLNALKREINQETPSSVQPQNINITVNIPEPAKETIITTTPEYKAEVEKASEKSIEKPVEAPKKVETKKEITAKTVTSKNTKPAEKNTATVKAAPKKAPAAEPAKPVQFWVQVSAYGSKKGAENARSILDENKIPADIFTYKDNKDKLFYRVRVGPYTTKSEAEYWRSKIIQIDEFSKAESFVTSTN